MRIMIATAFGLFFSAGLIISDGARAQVSKTPEIAAELRNIGPNADPQSIKKTLELYGPLHVLDTGEDLNITTDQVYGNHTLQKLDVFSSKDAKNLPVFVFTHGGGFVAGDKKQSHNIGRWTLGGTARHDWCDDQLSVSARRAMAGWCRGFGTGAPMGEE